MLGYINVATASTNMTVGDVATLVNSGASVDNLPYVIFKLGTIIGAFLFIKGLMKIKEANESRGQVKYSTAILLIVAGTALGVPPILVDSGVGTLGISLNDVGVDRIASR